MGDGSGVPSFLKARSGRAPGKPGQARGQPFASCHRRKDSSASSTASRSPTAPPSRHSASRKSTREMNEDARTNRWLPLRSSQISTEVRTCRFAALLVPRLPAHRRERNGQRDLSHARHRSHRRGQRVHECRRERQPGKTSLLPELWLAPLRRLDGPSRPHGRSRRHARRSVLRQAGSEHLGCQRARLGVSGRQSGTHRAAATSAAAEECGLTRSRHAL